MGQGGGQSFKQPRPYAGAPIKKQFGGAPP